MEFKKDEGCMGGQSSSYERPLISVQWLEFFWPVLATHPLEELGHLPILEADHR